MYKVKSTAYRWNIIFVLTFGIENRQMLGGE